MVEQIMDSMTWISMLFFLAGFIGLGIEMLAPGISVPGILGSMCLVVGVLVTADSFTEGIIMTLVIIGIVVMMMTIMLRALAKGKIAGPLILGEAQTKTDGYISGQDFEAYIGKKGVALTDLRPSGTGEFTGERLDILTEGSYVIKGTPIEIYKVEGVKVFVKSIDEKGV